MRPLGAGRPRFYSLAMLIRLALIALVLLTSLSLGVARGQLRAGTGIILCGGAPVVTDPDDPQNGARYCPDMAAGLLAALDLPPVTAAPERQPWRRADPPGVLRHSPLSQPRPQARGPPPPRAA